MDDETAFDAAGNETGILFDPFTGNFFRVNKPLEKRAVASAKVEDARGLGNPVLNSIVNAGMHCEILFAMVFVVEVMAHEIGEWRIVNQK